MKIYTSNFATFKSLQKSSLVGISISRFGPKYFKGSEFPPLFPPAKLLYLYKNKKIDWKQYSDLYNIQLSCLKKERVLEIIKMIGGSSDVVLLCFENKGENCHRRLVADWLMIDCFDGNIEEI